METIHKPVYGRNIHRTAEIQQIQKAELCWGFQFVTQITTPQATTKSPARV